MGWGVVVFVVWFALACESKFPTNCIISKADLLCVWKTYCLQACMCAMFSQETLQARAVKGLMNPQFFLLFEHLYQMSFSILKFPRSPSLLKEAMFLWMYQNSGPCRQHRYCLESRSNIIFQLSFRFLDR